MGLCVSWRCAPGWDVYEPVVTSACNRKRTRDCWCVWQACQLRHCCLACHRKMQTPTAVFAALAIPLHFTRTGKVGNGSTGLTQRTERTAQDRQHHKQTLHLCEKVFPCGACVALARRGSIRRIPWPTRRWESRPASAPRPSNPTRTPPRVSCVYFPQSSDFAGRPLS